MLQSACMIFFAAYLNVLLLGLQSKIMRDDRWRLAIFTSIGITFAQTGTMWAVAHSVLTMPWFLLFSSTGGAAGIVSSHFLYNWMPRRG